MDLGAKDPTRVRGGAGEGFNGNRLRKLQLVRARSSLTTGSGSADPAEDAFRRWSRSNSSINEESNSIVESGRNFAPSAYGAAATTTTTSRSKYHHHQQQQQDTNNNRFVYVLPEPAKESIQHQRAFSSSGYHPSKDRYNGIMDHDEEFPKKNLAYPHGMPRWGPRLVSRNSSAAPAELTGSSSTIPAEKNGGSTPAPPPKNPDNSNNNKHDDDDNGMTYKHHTSTTGTPTSRAAKKRMAKQARQNEIIEKAKAQSLLAAARAIQNLSSSSSTAGAAAASAATTPSPKKKQIIAAATRGEAGKQLPSLRSRIFLGRPRTLLQSARIKQAHVIQQSNDHIQQVLSVNDDTEEEEEEEEEQQSSTPNSESSEEDEEDDDDGSIMLSIDDSVSGLENDNDDDDDDDAVSGEDDDDDDDAVIPPPEYRKFAPKKLTKAAAVGRLHQHTTAGLRSLFRQQKGSLLQSARIKQAHVMLHANKDHSHIRQVRSLEDPLQQRQRQELQKHNAVGTTARSVQSFEYLHSAQPTPTPKYEPIKVETVESSDSEDENHNKNGVARCPIQEENSAYNNGIAIEEIPNFGAGSTDSPQRSWSMNSSSDSNPEQANNGAASPATPEEEDELSIDETIEDSTGLMEDEEEEADLVEEEELSSRPPRTPQSTSIPTMILSEVDPESSSRFSDCSSSLALMKTSSNITQGEEDDADEFFDTTAEESCTKDGGAALAGAGPKQSSLEKDQPFNAQRCRELLTIRNKYLERDEKHKLLSPKAASRLSTIPSLSRGATETTLLELATRGRWLEKNDFNQSAAYPPGRRGGRQRPSLASMPDDRPSFQPISLVAPVKISKPVVTTRKEPWHVAATTGDDGADQQDGNNAGAVSLNRAGRGKTPFKTKVKRFLLRCMYYLLFLLWAARTSTLLRDKFIADVKFLVGPVVVLTESNEVVPLEEVVCRVDSNHVNASNYCVSQPGTTHTRSLWIEMPIIFFDPPKPEVFAVQEIPNTESKRPQKCFANITEPVRSFWELRYVGLHEILDENDDEGTLTGTTHSLESDAGNRVQNPLFFAEFYEQTVCDNVLSMCYVTAQAIYSPKEDQSLVEQIKQKLSALDVSTDFRLPYCQDSVPIVSEHHHMDIADFGSGNVQDRHQKVPQCGDLRTGSDHLKVEGPNAVVSDAVDSRASNADDTKQKIHLWKSLGDIVAKALPTTRANEKAPPRSI